MTKALLQQFDSLNVWQRNDSRAPHKPLLALWAIGQCLQGGSRLAEYGVIHDAMVGLLRSFGPPRKNDKPQEPFWRMQKDRVWEVTRAEEVPVQANGSVSPANLRRLNVLGGLPAALYDAFRHDRALALTIAQRLVDAHFPATMRSAVLEATLGDHAADMGEPSTAQDTYVHSPLLGSAVARRGRSPVFRRLVLETYAHQCAVCNYSFEFPAGHWPALEAAHIKWHSHRGPDHSTNGLSLCVLHHELFDWGIFTIEPDTLNIRISGTILEQASDSPVTSLHGKPIQVIPKSGSDRPATQFLKWHHRNVFRA